MAWECEWEWDTAVRRIGSGDSSSLFKYFFDRVRRGMNSGVMYINVKNATQYADGLIEYAAAKGYRSFSTADQVTKLTRIKTTAIHRGYSHY